MNPSELQDEIFLNISKINTNFELQGGITNTDIINYLTERSISKATSTTYTAVTAPLLFFNLLFPGGLNNVFSNKKQLISQKLINLLTFLIIILLLYYFVDQDALKYFIRDKQFPLNILKDLPITVFTKEGINSYTYFVETLKFSKINILFLLNSFFNFLSNEEFYNMAYPNINPTQQLVQNAANSFNMFALLKKHASYIFKSEERIKYEKMLEHQKFIEDVLKNNFSVTKSVKQLDVSLKVLTLSYPLINIAQNLIISTFNLMYYKTTQAIREGLFDAITTRAIIGEKDFYNKDDTVFAGTVNWFNPLIPYVNKTISVPYSYSIEEYICMDKKGTSYPPKSKNNNTWEILAKYENETSTENSNSILSIFNYFTVTNGIFVSVIGIIFGYLSKKDIKKNLYIQKNEEDESSELILNEIFIGFMIFNFMQLIYLLSKTGIFKKKKMKEKKF